MTIKPPTRSAFLGDAEARQKNTLWPEATANAVRVDEFLWKDSPDATLVQRIGACIFGLTFILGGVAFADVVFEKHESVFGILSVLWFLLGGRVFLNGFKRRKPEPSNPNDT